MFVPQFPRNSIWLHFLCSGVNRNCSVIAQNRAQVFPALLLANKEGTINDCQHSLVIVLPWHCALRQGIQFPRAAFNIRSIYSPSHYLALWAVC